MNTGTVLEIKSLSAGYEGMIAAADVSLSLRRGEILCIVGESGCGKSTLLKAILGTDPKVRLFSGEIELEGEPFYALPERRRRRLCSEKIGMVFQNPGESFDPIRSYRKQFAETLKSRGVYDKTVFEGKAADTLESLGFTDINRVLDSCPFELSGGMNQRMAIALMLLLGQNILLADEPTGALDSTVQLQTARALKKLSERGISQIIVTHNIALARFLADRTGVMYAGRLVELARTGELIGAPRHPYTRALMAAVPRPGGDIPAGIDGTPPLYGPEEKGCEFRYRCPYAGRECAEREYSPAYISDGHMCSCEVLCR